jgi:two-component sensor histidine kinase
VAVTPLLWQPVGVPEQFTEVWRHELRSVPDLARLRARLRTELTGSSGVVDPGREHWSERMVLVVDELASNALRHGGAPVSATLSRSRDDWLIAVSDTAAGTPPRPAQGRDPAHGGFGLYLVADLTQRRGWWTTPREKVVWAVVSASS